jgi:3-deoxy-D-manno-octulosonic-acid transferase
LLQPGAVLQVKDASDLEKTIETLLADPARRAELGRLARKVVDENLGAVERTVEMIMPHLVQRGIFIAPAKK